MSRSEQGGSLAGHGFAPQTSRRIPARLVWAADTARLEDAQGTLLVQGPVQKTEQLPGGPLLVHLKDGWHFEAEPGENELKSLGGLHRPGLLARMEEWHPRLILFSLFCLLSAFVIWRWGLGLLVAIGLAVTPETAVRGIDSANIEIIDRTLAEDTGLSQQAQQKVQAIFDDLRKAAPPAPWGEYHLLFRDMPEVGLNAFALPGGSIIITDQLVERFEDPDIIAAVLGHEIAHVSERHALAQLYRAGSTYLLITLVAGDPGPLLQDLLREGNVLLSLSYSRQHETEADRLGVRIANKAGYDGAALAGFFELLAAESEGTGPGWLSTHPAAGDRIMQIRAYSTEAE